MRAASRRDPFARHPYFMALRKLDEVAAALADYRMIRADISIGSDGLLLGKGKPLADVSIGYALEILTAKLYSDRRTLQRLRQLATKAQTVAERRARMRALPGGKA